jgi:hypothetical protein
LQRESLPGEALTRGAVVCATSDFGASEKHGQEEYGATLQQLSLAFPPA